MTVFLISFVAVVAAMAAMAVGVIFGHRRLTGSCGALGARRGDDGNLTCSLCSKPPESCPRQPAAEGEAR